MSRQVEEWMAKDTKYWILRLWAAEQLGCTNCGEITHGSNEVVVYVWVALKQEPKVEEKDEMDVYCPICWEKEVE